MVEMEAVVSVKVVFGEEAVVWTEAVVGAEDVVSIVLVCCGTLVGSCIVD